MKITETELLLAVHHTALDFHGPHCFYVKFEMVVTPLCGGLKCQCQLQGKQARSEAARCCCEWKMQQHCCWTLLAGVCLPVGSPCSTCCCIVLCAVSDLLPHKDQSSGEMFLQQWGTHCIPKIPTVPVPPCIYNSVCPFTIMLLAVDIVIYCSVLACWNNACNCLHVARACVNCMFCTYCDCWLALLHKERKLLGNSWRWEGGVASQSEIEGLQDGILNYTCAKGRSHGGHFLRPPAPWVACGVSCRWCPWNISFVGHAFQFLAWK